MSIYFSPEPELAFHFVSANRDDDLEQPLSSGRADLIQHFTKSVYRNWSARGIGCQISEGAFKRSFLLGTEFAKIVCVFLRSSQRRFCPGERFVALATKIGGGRYGRPTIQWSLPKPLIGH